MNARQISTQSSESDYLGPLLSNANGQNDAWKGVGSMNGPMSCTVNLVEPPGGCEPRDDQPAMIVTNGHCVGLVTRSPNVMVNQEFSADVNFNHFKDSQPIKAKATKVLYGNMNTKDLAVVQLNMTYGELKAKGVKPLKIAKQYRPDRMKNVASPVDGVPAEDRFLRANECASGDRVNLMEGSFVWKNQISFACPASGGSSGSALVSEKSGEIMGLLNTGIRQLGEPGPPCQFNSPCELGSSTGNQSQTDMRYGFDLTFLHQCASNSCEIDVTRKDCPLPATPQAIPFMSDVTNKPDDPILLDPLGGTDFDRYMVKVGPAGSTDCSDPSGYTETGSPYRPPKTGNQDGLYVVCARGHRAASGWQDWKDVRTKSFRVDRVPTIASLKPTANGKALQVLSSDSTDPVVGFRYKYANSESDCKNANGYKKPPIQWGGRSVSLTEASGSYVCVLSFDLAGNAQQPQNASTYRVR